MVNQKYLAAVISTRPWDDLTLALGAFDMVELLSPCMNVAELVKSPSIGLLDIVFVDADEFDFESAEADGLSTGFEPYLVFIAETFDPERMRAAMQSGARDFLTRPLSPKDLSGILRRASDYRQSRLAAAMRKADQESEQPHVAPENFRIFTFFSTKGGAGKSTLASNFALALASISGKSVCLVDLALQFGDLALILNVKPRAGIANLTSTPLDQIAEEIPPYITRVTDRVSLLAPPMRPEDSELVRADHVTEILRALASRFDYVVIDTPASFSDVSLAALDISTTIYLVATTIILSIKNLKSAIGVMENSLGYPHEKMKIVLNRSDSEAGIDLDDIRRITNREISYAVPSDGKIVVPSINKGIPAILGNPKSKFSLAVCDMARNEAGITTANHNGNGHGNGKLTFMGRLRKGLIKIMQ